LVSDRSDWAPRLAAAVAFRFAETTEARDTTVQLHSARATSPETVEIIYSDSMYVGLKGIRIDFAAVRAGSELFREASVDELALNLINLGMLEPRPLDEFLPADTNGVRWLPLRRWLEDL
jgi:hypothetical protein